MLIRHRLFQSAVVAVAIIAPTGASAKGLKVLHSFAGPPSDGSYPYNNVTFDKSGDILGASDLGGSANSGTIFKIARDGTETVLHSFDGGSGGSDPNGGVTIDPSGNIFGTTTFGGGQSCRNGCGVLYELAASGKFTVLQTFNPASNGESPVGTLVRNKSGDLFGVAGAGGAHNGGTVFEYSAKGAFSVLYAFGGSDGFQPVGNLLIDKQGNLYGATNSGGADQYGTIFELTPKGKLTTLYSFTGSSDGGYPAGGLARDKSGNLYGATNLAGNGSTPFGTVFELNSGGLTTLYTFADGNDGGYPAGNILYAGGKVYGTTTSGGADQCGVVYAVDLAAKPRKSFTASPTPTAHRPRLASPGKAAAFMAPPAVAARMTTARCSA